MAETPEHVLRALCPLAPAAQGRRGKRLGPHQRLPMARTPLEGWSQEEWQASIGEVGRPSGLKAETARGIGGGEKRWEHVTKPEPVIKPPSCVGLCERSHLESGYVASQAAGSVLPLGCRHLANGQVFSPSRVRAKGSASPFWSRAGHLLGSILIMGTWQKSLIQIEALLLG